KWVFNFKHLILEETSSEHVLEDEMKICLHIASFSDPYENKRSTFLLQNV
ncbi:hypothetical protein JTE90_005109, partial [Oedothorax gibbosus]